MERVMSSVEDHVANEKVARGAILTDRDKQVIAYLAIARYLSTEQIHRLAFPGRIVPPCRRRLLRLAGLWKSSKRRATKAGVQENFRPAYLRRRELRTFQGGQILEVWALTEPGYILAEQVLRTPVRVPRNDVSGDFLEHSVALNDVLVGLADPTSRPCSRCGRADLKWATQGKDAYTPLCSCGHQPVEGIGRAEELPFKWTTSEFSRLPWTEYDRRSGKRFDRVIHPDAVLELGGRRYFLECEMGSHSIEGNDNKPGATLAKAERYGKFLHALAPGTNATFYAQAFGDECPAEVLFIVPAERRRDNVRAALEAWLKAGNRLAVRTFTFTEAPTALLNGKLPVRSSPQLLVTSEEVRELHRFYNEVIGPLKQARATARAARSVVPDYPGGAEAVGNLLRRLVNPTDVSNGGAR